MALSKTLFHQHHFAPYRPDVMLQRVKRRNAGTRIQPRHDRPHRMSKYVVFARHRQSRLELKQTIEILSGYLYYPGPLQTAIKG